jgi:hypothetical protein
VELNKEVYMATSSGVLRVRLALPATLLFALLVTLPRAAAQTSNQSQEQIKVVAHLPLDGMHVNQMFVQQRDSKFYLYLHRPTKDAFALVDVTDPNKPVLVSRDSLKEPSGTQLQPPASGSAFAVAVTPEGGASTRANVQLPTETVQLVDMSNPKNARSVKTFKGVTSIYPDDARKLVYLVNGEGLWIVSHRMTKPLPLCSSESALTSLPDCQ